MRRITCSLQIAPECKGILLRGDEDEAEPIVATCLACLIEEMCRKEAAKKEGDRG